MTTLAADLRIVVAAVNDPCVRRVVDDVDLDEPFDHCADLVVVGLLDDEPIGLVAGRGVEDASQQRAALLEHILLRSAWRDGGHAVAMADAWARLARHRGFPEAVCGIECAKDRREITRLALRWGFRPYAEAADRIWYRKSLLVHGAAVEAISS